MNIFKDIFNLIKTEEGQKALPLVANAVTSVAANPTLVNAQAQGGLLLAQLISAEIGIGQDALKAIAADITASAVAASTAPAPVTSPTPVPTPADPVAALKAATA
jgi:hypothetical protein